MALSQEDILLILKLRDEASPALKQTANSVNALGQAGLAAKVALAAAGTALTGLAMMAAKTGISFNAMKEQAQIAFTSMLGSAEKAKGFLAELQTFAAKTPFEFPGLLQSSQRLLAMGFAAKDLIPTLTSLGDAAAAMGGGAEMIGRLTTAIGQMSAKGKVSGEEMRQFAEAGIPAWKFLADTLGLSIPDAMKKVETGAVSAAVGIAAITDGMNNKFGGMMAKQATTFNGLMSTVKDNLRIFAGEVSEGMFQASKANLEKFMKWFDENRQGMLDGLSAWSGGFKEFGRDAWTGIKVVWDGLKGFYAFITMTKPQIIATLALIGIAIYTALGPVSLAVLAVTAIIVTIGYFKRHWEELSGVIATAVNRIKGNMLILGLIFGALILTVGAPIAALILAVVLFRDEFVSAFKWIADKVGPIIGWIGDRLDDLMDKIGDFIEGVAKLPGADKLGLPQGQIFEGGFKMDLTGLKDLTGGLTAPLRRSLQGTNGGGYDVLDPETLAAMEAAALKASDATQGAASSAGELSDAAKALKSALEDVTRTLTDDVIAAYLKGGRAASDVVKATNVDILARTKALAADLVKNLGVDPAVALTSAFAHIRKEAEDLTAKTKELADARKAITDSNTADLVDAWITGGDAAVAILRATQAAALTETERIALHFEKLFGIDLADAMGKAKKATDGLNDALRKTKNDVFELTKQLWANAGPGLTGDAAVKLMRVAEQAGANQTLMDTLMRTQKPGAGRVYTPAEAADEVNRRNNAQQETTVKVELSSDLQPMGVQ